MPRPWLPVVAFQLFGAGMFLGAYANPSYATAFVAAGIVAQLAAFVTVLRIVRGTKP